MERDYDLDFLRRAIAVARRSRQNGNHPFGALLVDQDGQLLMEAENTVVTTGDCTGHAETNLMRQASQVYEREFLAGCTLYTSTEPCPMCSGAIFWGNVGRVVYGLSEAGLYALAGDGPEAEVLYLPCRQLFARGNKPLEIIGPLLEEQAREVHVGFWE
jgi:tRNA(Arg) A34 adenosine deaminase TadA